MARIVTAIVCFLSFSSIALAQHLFAQITSVDAEKGTITYRPIAKKDKDKKFTLKVAKDCVIREGIYRLGKPARLEEKEVIVNGLKNFVFQNASAEVPLRVNLYTADADDADKNIKKGDVIKILVNPGQ